MEQLQVTREATRVSHIFHAPNSGALKMVSLEKNSLFKRSLTRLYVCSLFLQHSLLVISYLSAINVFKYQYRSTHYQMSSP